MRPVIKCCQFLKAPTSVLKASQEYHYEVLREAAGRAYGF